MTEVQLIAVADDADESRHGLTYIKPVTFKVTADSIVQKDLDSQNKVDYELWVEERRLPVTGTPLFRRALRRE